MPTITQEQLTPIEEQLKAIQQSTAEMMKRIAEEGIISEKTGEVLVPPTLKIPETEPPPVDTSNIQTGLADMEYWQKQYEKAQKRAEEERKAYAEEKKTLWEKLTAQPTLTEQRKTLWEEIGIEPKTYFADIQSDIAKTQSIMDQINARTAQMNTDVSNMQARPGVTLDYQERSVNEIKRLANLDIAPLAAQAQTIQAIMQMKQGNFDTARSFVNEAVDNYTYDLNLKYKQFDEFMEMNQDEIDRLDTATQDALDRAFTIARDNLATAKQETKDKLNLLIDAQKLGIDLGIPDISKVSYEDMAKIYNEKIPEYLQNLDEIPSSQWPTSYREWYMAGGQKGTGKSYNDWMEARRTSSQNTWEKQVQGYANRGITNLDLFKKEIGITTDEQGNWEYNEDVLNKIRLFKTPTSTEIKTAVAYFDAALLYLVYSQTGRGVYPGELEAMKKTYGVDWIDVAAFPEAGLSKLQNVERMLKMTLENPSTSPFVQQMGQISDAVKGTLEELGY